MRDVWIVGTATTAVRKWPERSFRDLAAEAVRGALHDAGGVEVEDIAFGNCAMHHFGQRNLRGQVTLEPLLADGTLPRHAPVTNVECGCATGSAAFSAAVRAVRSGDVDVALAVGVEKTVVSDDPETMRSIFLDGIDQLHPDEWRSYFADEAARADLEWSPHPARVLFLDVHALLTRAHMARFGTTTAQIAAVASKNHHHGSLNDKAQYRFEVSVDQVLADRPVVDPLTRAMCAPMSDGAAAVIVASEAVARDLDRRVRVAGLASAGGAYRPLDGRSVTHAAAARLWSRAPFGPDAIDVAEVHDATAGCEILHLEALGLQPEGQGGARAAAGETALGGPRPVNVSGGLESRGHPLAATGLGMIDELVTQLRGEAGARQVPGARRALAHNAGGAIGLD
ncbi:MAG: thiolase family protein, partial [Myxococcota bacterium]